MTDRADEIAERALRSWEVDEPIDESHRTSELAALIRAYGISVWAEGLPKGEWKDALQAKYEEGRNAALEEVLVITDGMEGTEWDAAGDWLGKRVRALKEPKP